MVCVCWTTNIWYIHWSFLSARVVFVSMSIDLGVHVADCTAVNRLVSPTIRSSPRAQPSGLDTVHQKLYSASTFIWILSFQLVVPFVARWDAGSATFRSSLKPPWLIVASAKFHSISRRPDTLAEILRAHPVCDVTARATRNALAVLVQHRADRWSNWVHTYVIDWRISILLTKKRKGMCSCRGRIGQPQMACGYSHTTALWIDNTEDLYPAWIRAVCGRQTGREGLSLSRSVFVEEGLARASPENRHCCKSDFVRVLCMFSTCTKKRKFHSRGRPNMLLLIPLMGL